MRRDIVTAAIAIVVLTVLLGVIYPLAVTGVRQAVFPGNANGQKLYINGRLVGSKRIGQQFADPVLDRNGKPKLDKSGNPVTNPDPRYFQTRPSAPVPHAKETPRHEKGDNPVTNPDPRYFQTRPSATVPPDNAAGTAFSNLGPN